MLPAALVFDFDGTIVDTEIVEYDSMRLVWEDHGHAYPIERFAGVIGTTDSAPWIEELERALGEPLDRAAVERRQLEYRRALLAEVQPRPGIVALIEEAAAFGIPLGVASNSSLSWIEDRLATVHLSGRFGALLAADVSSAPKPDPAPYLEACRALGADPRQSAAFEDSHAGVCSATSAGCFTIACPGPLTAGHDLSLAHRTIETHASVTLAVLSGWLDEHVRRPTPLAAGSRQSSRRAVRP